MNTRFSLPVVMLLLTVGITFAADTKDAVDSKTSADSKVGAETQTISTIAGTGKPKLDLFSGVATEVNIGQPFGVEVDGKGNLFITEVENHRVFKMNLTTKQIETIAGNGKKGFSGDGGPAKDASLNEPYEVRIAKDGTIYFVEMVGAIIRKIDPETGIIQTIAGTGKPGFSGDGGAALKAQFNKPHSIALDDQNRMFVADISNHRIRQIDLKSGIITTIAGTGKKGMPSDGEIATGQPIFGPRALYIQENTMWIALREGNSIWKMDLSNYKLTHVAGTGKKGQQDGAGKQATFNGPKGIVAGSNDDVYVVDTENQVIRHIDAKSFEVTTVAGSGVKGRGYGGDNGPALNSKMDRPHGMTIDKQGALYIGDTNNHRVRMVE